MKASRCLVIFPAITLVIYSSPLHPLINFWGVYWLPFSNIKLCPTQPIFHECTTIATTPKVQFPNHSPPATYLRSTYTTQAPRNSRFESKTENAAPVTSKKRTPLRSTRYIDHDYGDDLIAVSQGRQISLLCLFVQFLFHRFLPHLMKKKVWYFPIPDANANIDSSLWSSGGQSLAITLLVVKTFRNS